MHIVEEEPGETPLTLGCLSYLINSFLRQNIQLKTSRWALFLPPSNVYVRSFLYLFYTLIKLYYRKALSDQASSLAPDRILLLRRPRNPASFLVQQHPFIQSELREK